MLGGAWLRTMATRAALVLAGLALFAAPAGATGLSGPIPDKGDTAWVLVSAALVLLMSVPGLALFYGGLVRAKNMLSVLMQVFTIVAISALAWVGWGYSLAFTSGGPLVGGLSKAFLVGVGPSSLAATFSNGVVIPEYAYAVFQMTFACITPALIVGAFAERVRFWPLMLFVLLWLTIVYYPLAHMVWYWAGPDALPANPGDVGLLFGWGALDFAGGTVVHINAGIAGLVGCLLLGKRIGFATEPMPPHSLVMTMIGASLLWVGWFGFNAGSALEANGIAALAFINTLVAAAAAALAWAGIEQGVHGKSSLLGAATGAVAGLVAITPAAGFAAPGTSILLGGAASAICFLFVARVKNRLGYDDSLDVFGVHCIGGIVGALGTAIVAAPALGGQGTIDYSVIPAVPAAYDMAAQLLIQAKAVAFTLLWSGGLSALLFVGIDRLVGLRVSRDSEREGLDISAHGERAYHS